VPWSSVYSLLVFCGGHGGPPSRDCAFFAVLEGSELKESRSFMGKSSVFLKSWIDEGTGYAFSFVVPA
jgi:hypothetical protein